VANKYAAGRPEKLTNDRKKDIIEIFDSHKNWSKKKIYIEGVKKWKNIPGYLEIPGYDTVRNFINNEVITNEGNPLDKPWSLGSLAQSNIPPIPPEALPTVLRIYAEEYIIENDRGGPPPRPPLTIREAQWVARLSHVKRYDHLIQNDAFLTKCAQEYAVRERIYEISHDDRLKENFQTDDYQLLYELSETLKDQLGPKWADSISNAYPPVTKIVYMSDGEVIEKINLNKESGQ
jgi:hypothetical protein